MCEEKSSASHKDVFLCDSFFLAEEEKSQMTQPISTSLSKAASSLTRLGERRSAQESNVGGFIVLSRVVTVVLQLLQPYKYRSL